MKDENVPLELCWRILLMFSKMFLWLVNVNVPADLVVTSMKNMKNLQKVPVVWWAPLLFTVTADTGPGPRDHGPWHGWSGGRSNSTHAQDSLQRGSLSLLCWSRLKVDESNLVPDTGYDPDHIWQRCWGRQRLQESWHTCFHLSYPSAQPGHGPVPDHNLNWLRYTFCPPPHHHYHYLK